MVFITFKTFTFGLRLIRSVVYSLLTLGTARLNAQQRRAQLEAQFPADGVSLSAYPPGAKLNKIKTTLQPLFGRCDPMFPISIYCPRYTLLAL